MHRSYTPVITGSNPVSPINFQVTHSEQKSSLMVGFFLYSNSRYEMKILLITLATLLVVGCCKSSNSAVEGDELVKCYSGGQLIYEGLVNHSSISNGTYSFYSNNRKYHINADCIISYEIK